MSTEPAPGWPSGDPAGRFLLIMRDPHAEGGTYVRRFATKADAVGVYCNYLGHEGGWLFEVEREINLEPEATALLDSIEF